MFLDNKLDESAIPTTSVIDTGQPSDVTATRAVNTAYQNTTGRTKRVRIFGSTHVNGAVGAYALLDGYVAAVSGDLGNAGTDRGECGIEAALIITVYGSFTFEVPNNYYYKVASSLNGVGSAATINRWLEQTL